MKHVKILLGAVAVLYPVLVFLSLVVFKINHRYISVFIVALAITYFIVNRKNYKGKDSIVLFVTPAALLIIGTICVFSKSELVLKLYPVLADIAYLLIFGTSLFFPPPMVYYFITLLNKTIEKNIPAEKFIRFCRRATFVWCIFFVLDGIVAYLTAVGFSDIIWGIYNGGITYAIIGLLFAGDFIVVKFLEKKEMAAAKNLEARDENT
jgi:uncharacterized membrane protein